ncbi:hypothetical protein GLAREA_05327 [Glarea lozoyensis ATCC 20868]|uniref:Zn(2)-C6 fungal-type domain-containing protein n=1 Tax=Glarea lozoyensis (strain ATCC 20868 / MF5171) TaxID=1116229 RepID=S3DFS0_GLAL2|nr:uncharacterized protein GLAREA_05327 [Glarea lozoyensis ATCC 20868]EPE35989.1 hypothetical protein GLAREA_05327 [Glarea lozoyensis ATCC 20868]
MASDPDKHLLFEVDIHDLSSIRRIMASTEYMLTNIVLNPMADQLTCLTEEERSWVYSVCASIRNHPKRCLLLCATLGFSAEYLGSDEDIRAAISDYCSVGPANVLLHPSLFEEEYDQLEKGYCGAKHHSPGPSHLDDLVMLAPTAFSHQQISSVRRARQLEKLARERKINVEDITIEEALAPLPQGRLLGSFGLQTVNLGACSCCKRLSRYCDRREPLCSECRRTWNTGCTYTSRSAGTVQNLENARQARHLYEAQKRKDDAIQRTEEKQKTKTTGDSQDGIINNLPKNSDINSTNRFGTGPSDTARVQTNRTNDRSDQLCNKPALSIEIPNFRSYIGPYDEFFYNDRVYSPISPMSQLSSDIDDPFPPGTFEYCSNGSRKSSSETEQFGSDTSSGSNSWLEFVTEMMEYQDREESEQNHISTAQDTTLNPVDDKPARRGHRMVTWEGSIDFDAELAKEEEILCDKENGLFNDRAAGELDLMVVEDETPDRHHE